MQERVTILAGRIKDNRTLVSFLGKAEKEYMVAETIHAAANNLKTYGEAFSIRGDNVFVRGGWFDNKSSYEALVDGGFFREEERTINGKSVVVIFPTELLLNRLEQFLSKR